ncbi:acyltransferase family protein [Actinoplanes rectilineatus]|uniref:acyltransferase family protein n=1 Tax=Actinoplanes rectilineatus TaxID=113571 RepID=UPI0005F29699|nr:acyltransferase [Actinoplanes rectilineatus]
MSSTVADRDVGIPRRIVDLPSLTGMRWTAAFLVFGVHLHVIEYFAPGWAASVIRFLFAPGAVGVSFFFILSGFVLMWASPDPVGWLRFCRRRFARVYPLHAVTAVFALLLAFVTARNELPQPLVVLANLTLLQSWIPDFTVVQGLNSVSWTLSCEAFFYAVFPLLGAVIGRRGPGALLAVAGAAWALTTLGPAAGRLFASAEAVTLFFHWNPLARLPEFVFGIALACLVRSNPAGVRLPLLWTAAGVTTIAGYLTVKHVPEVYGYAACTMLGFGLVLVAAALADSRGSWTPWRHRLAVKLGELSFAFYLIHILVIRVFEAVVGYHPKLGTGPGAALTAATFTLALTSAWLLHRFVEGPARRLLLRL